MPFQERLRVRLLQPTLDLVHYNLVGLSKGFLRLANSASNHASLEVSLKQTRVTVLHQRSPAY